MLVKRTLIEYRQGQFGDLARPDGDAFNSEACATCGQPIGYAAAVERKGDRKLVHFTPDRRAGWVVDCETGHMFATQYDGRTVKAAQDVNEGVQSSEVTGHGFSCHSRRPSECRVCKLPAARHTYAEVSEAHSVSIWRTMRHPLVTDRMKDYSDRTLNVLRHIADLGGEFDAWDRGNRGWHKTAVSILEKDGLFVRTNDGEAPGRYVLTEAGVQACSWHGITIKSDREVMVSEMSKPTELDASDIAEDIAQQWCEAGSPRDAQGRPVIEGSKPEADDIARSEDNGCAETSMCDDDECGACAHCRMLATVTEETVTDVFVQAMAESEREIWAGTGTMIEVTPKVRTFRKVKNTRSARRRRGGK